ncbi:alpha-L-fucosidase [Chitinophaga pendula]|uniref:alpha-L-fucosidase n=1 Tax=Chitinophaga TaxID=79328 RepID=UPI000BAF5C5D|nr:MULTISPECIES: alpha-L-fucosidase [Chitinophaga]ASZ09523.1 alpha-L-fucosidase [Chitinophaga sp. MD30]UCJ07543.1 alpha-L-fucosidase [Chitinophaga pendula]
MKKLWSTLAATVLTISVACAQEAEIPYVPEKDPAVLQKLEEWQDWKFGLIMHWGPYSQWGVVESWSLCPEDEGWTQRKPAGIPYYEYVQKYEALGRTFNPTNFDPARWAKAAKEAGMKYLVFTTKHHDGYCMFDTKQTDYKITAPSNPFSKDPRADVTKAVFEAFRKEGIHTGAYFSKPDWHTEYYWWPYFPPKDRNVNYDIKTYPQRWEQFRQFTYNQIEELMTGYGKVEILWLDGGWVRPLKQQTKESLSWSKLPPQDQDINMPAITAMARKHQPGLIVVDRSVHGPYENYRTPEQQIPDKPLDYPWETCMTMGGSWSYSPDDKYKSVTQLVHNLVDIVAKGGNYLLNIGPGPDGTWHEAAYTTMKEIGSWMNTNGDAIYGTRSIAPYKDGKVCFTRKKDGSVYAIYLLDEGEQLPAQISFNGLLPAQNARLSLLGNNTRLKWKKEGNKVMVTLPPSTPRIKPQHAIAIHISAIEK